MRNAIARGSWGEVHFNPATGIPVHHVATYPGSSFGYRNVARFDVREWAEAYPNESLGEVDILDIGFWATGGEYTPPEMDYRREIAAGRKAVIL